MMGMMDDDAHMLCKVLDSVAGQALELKKKIKMGKKLPSWAEYKVYKAGDSIKSAMSSTFSIRDHMPRISIAIKSAPPMGGVLPSNMKKMAMMGNSPFTQQMMKGSGLPGYSKGGPVKKDGYLTDKKGKPYARVHKGEKVVPKDEKTKKAWAKLAMIGDPTIAPVRNIGTNNSVSTSAPKVKAPKATSPKDNSRGLSYFSPKTFPLFDSKGNRTISTGRVNKKNYKLRAREALTNKSPYAGKGLDYIRAAQRGAESVTKVKAPKATSGM